MRKFFSTYGRLILAVVGLLAIALLVHQVGPQKVLATILGAGAWLPLILALDLSWMAVEGVGLYVLYGRARENITLVDWLKATFLQYATFIVVPVGRASGELARAGALGPIVGKSQAAAGAALMQSLTLTANGLMSAICLTMVLLTTRHAGLTTLLGVNILVTGGLGVSLYLILRHVHVGGFVGKKFQKLAKFGPELDVYVRESQGRHLSALGFCLLGRLIQTAQYGLIFFAVVGTTSVSSAFVAEGIQLVGRSMGDAVPNQVGVIEGAFALCAGALNLAEHPEKAISLALLGRVSNLSVAGMCALGLQLLPKRRPAVAVEAPSASTR
jgi:hypothetical protein